MRSRITFGIIGGLFFATAVVRADEAPGDKAVAEAIKLLQAKKGQAEKKADREKIDSAIVALQKVLAAPLTPDDAPAPFKRDVLKSKFHGLPSFNVKTGELTLKYDFENPDQMKDFDLGGGKALVKNASVILRGAEKYTHIVPFKTMQVTAEVGVFRPLGFYLGTTQDLQLYLHENWNVEMWLDGQMAARKVLPEAQQARFLRFKMTVEEKRMVLQVGSLTLAGTVTDKPRGGRVMLMGGHNDGAHFRNLVITGIPEPEWVKTFLAK